MTKTRLRNKMLYGGKSWENAIKIANEWRKRNPQVDIEDVEVYISITNLRERCIQRHPGTGEPIHHLRIKFRNNLEKEKDLLKGYEEIATAPDKAVLSVIWGSYDKPKYGIAVKQDGKWYDQVKIEGCSQGKQCDTPIAWHPTETTLL